MSLYRNFSLSRAESEMEYLNKCGAPIRYKEDPPVDEEDDLPKNRPINKNKPSKEKEY